MSKVRDDFPPKVVERLAKRARYLCSAPHCGVPCVGPSDESSSAYSNIGRAAHITAAALKGPRYDANLTPEERASIENAIWLCATDAALIDTDTKTYTVELLKNWKLEHEQRVAEGIGRPSGLVEAREAAYLDWVRRVCNVLVVTKTREMKEAAGKHHPIGRLLAPSERTWAARAVQEGHLEWMPGSGGVVLPGDSFTFQPAHPDEPISFVVLDPGSFGDELDFNKFRFVPHFDFMGVPGHTAFEWGPPRGRSYFFRFGWPTNGPQPLSFGVGPARGTGPLGFMHDKVEGEATVNTETFRYFGASNPLTATTSVYIVFPKNEVPQKFIIGMAPAPVGPPPRWKLMTLRQQGKSGVR
ncbi:hypothetical protein [Hyalangium sp.]|uniref:hypothetical protein n=1 Tax=Hyalangium sp. TaxID=2028555 RepID=UPI002D6A92D9|nr:hypothetical protein [Hyalangium sp.]HYH98164.1 hypothetical protein [Hyalangium sp.]